MIDEKNVRGYRLPPWSIVGVAVVVVAGSYLALHPPGPADRGPLPKPVSVIKGSVPNKDADFLAAVSKGDLARVKALLQAGADVRTANEFGQTALHLVRDPKVAEYLLSQGADVEARDKEFQMTPLFSQEVPIAKLLVAAGADVNARSKKGYTPVIWYAYSNYYDGIRYLISVGADISARNDDGQTALDVSEHFASEKLTAFLRERMKRK